MAANEIMAPSVNTNCQYSTRYCWEAEKVKSLIRLRAELSPLFTGKRNASKYAWAVVERELNVPLPLSKIIKKWNNLLQEYKAIKMSEEPKRREWPFFTLMDVYFSDQVNDPSLRLFSSTKTLKETIDDSVFEDDPIISSAIAAATSGAFMDMDELIRRQKERAAERNKYAVAAGGGGAGSDFKYDIKPMLPNSKFNNSNEMVKLSKSVDDLTMQQFKLKEELLRQRDQEQQENIAKIKQHARQQQQQQQHQQQQHQRFHHQQAQQPPLSPHPHSRMAQSSTPPGLQHALQQQQQHMLQQQQRHLQQQLQQHHQQQQQQQQQQHQPPPPPPRPNSPPTTAQQIHITTAQHQAAQQQLQQQHQQQQQQQQQQHNQPQQQQTYTDPNTIDQYLLSWNNFHGNMCRGFHTLQKDEKMVDVTIAAGGKIFKAHKLVLSVCSPYFQQIFLENPSSHPILLMADVEASHMAGLLDFMYSGQVNVKYEDLPVFLKVAEAMKIKGLHTEKNMDSDASDISSPHESESTECRYERGTHSVNITSGHGYGGLAHLQKQQQQAHENNLNGPSNSGSNRSSTPLPMPGYVGFREHIKSKATLAETFMKNLNRNNNNSSNNNFNQLTNTATNGPSNHTSAGVGSSGTGTGAGAGTGTGSKLTEPLPNENYSIMQANSKKMLDTARKQHKYLAKRKILMHYNEEMNEKRLKEMDTERYGTDHEEHGDNNPETLDSAMTIVPQHNNNFRIRLVEKHQHNNSSNNNNTDNTSNENESNNNNNNNNSHDQEEEALNLVQTPCNAEQTRNSETPNMHLVKQEFDANEMAQDMSQEHSSGNGHDEHLAAYEQRGGKYDDNNNNKDDDETDTNNNSNKSSSNNDGQQMHLSKNASLINVINRNIEQEQQQQQQQQQQETTITTTGAAAAAGATTTGDLDNDNNNNNQSQLDLSTIKNIATAEILCGLKSKVLKMEEERERERERARERERERDSCRSLSEIKNAE